METFAKFLVSMLPLLWDVYTHFAAGKGDPEAEHQLALRVIRAAKDAQARAELT